MGSSSKVFAALVVAWFAADGTLPCTARPAQAATAYFSLVGNFPNPGDQHNFYFGLTRPVVSGEVLR